jgi:hypothetical protein
VEDFGTTALNKVVLLERLPVASWFGFLQCHSSILSRRYSPWISQGTYVPDERTTLPSKFLQHFPCLIYSSTPSQSLMNLSHPLNMHFVFLGGPDLLGPLRGVLTRTVRVRIKGFDDGFGELG